MNFDEYQEATSRTAIYPDQGEAAGVPIGVIYTAFGLAGEAGECAEKVKKAMRESPPHSYLVELEDELGDVLWYLAQLCTQLGVTLDSRAQANLDKLSSRKERGVLTGQGDDR